MEWLEPFDFVPHSLGPAKTFIYVVIFIHLAALLFWITRCMGESVLRSKRKSL